MASIFRDKLLEGRVALVTGGGSGINLRIAERFAQHGATVMLVGRKIEKLEAAAAGIREQGGKALIASADVRDYAAVEAAVQATVAGAGPIDIVVAGAAGNFPAPAASLSSNGFKSVMDIDVLGTFNICRAAFEHLRKPGASVIAISATQATQATPMQAHVCAAKAAVEMLTKTLAYEWGPAGVRVNAIEPGPIEETEGMKRLTPDEEMKRKLATTIPLGRYGTKDEIADLALFLSSGAASYITGAVFLADGGQSLGGSSAFVSVMTGG